MGRGRASAPSASSAKEPSKGLGGRSDPWTDLGLTLPIFITYHLGVALLPMRNAADPVTAELKALAKHSLPMYGVLTLAIGAAFVLALVVLGRGHALRGRRFVLIALEGALYAVLMRFAGSYAVGSLRLGPAGEHGAFAAVVMSFGAGFYEEVAFRVGLFGGGAFLLRRLVAEGWGRYAAITVWAVVAAAVFSGWHYVGPYGDPFQASSFVFRAVCGLVLTGIFVLRGFAPAVWTHALYDVWAMAL